jgi:hypothetical protein
MSLKVTLTITVTNPDTGWQQQTKDTVLSFDPEATPADIAERAMRFLKEEIDHPRLPLDTEDTSALSDEEWEASIDSDEREPETVGA